MKELVKFELAKMITSNFFRILVLLVGITVIAYYGYVYKQANELYDRSVTSHEYWAGEYGHNLIENKELIDSDQLSDEERTSLIMENKFFEDQIKENTILHEAYSNRDWKTILEVSNEGQEQWIYGGGFKYDDEFFDQLTFTFAANINRNKLMIERDITPVLPIEYSITFHNFDETDDAEARKRLKRSAQKYSPSTFYFLLMVFSISFSVIGVIIFIFMFGDILTKEGLGESGPIHLLYTQPIKKYEMMVSKFIALMMMTIGVIGVVWFLASLLGLVFDRMGDGNYPIMVYGEEYSFTFINLSTYLLQALILFGLVLLFSYSLLFLLSVLTKRTLASVGGTIIIILIGTNIGTEKILSSIAPYVPFNYFAVHEVITNEVAVSMDNFNMTYSLGIIILISSILLIWIVLLFNMRKA